MSDSNGTAIVIRDAQYEDGKGAALAMVTTPDEARERLRMLQDFVRSAMLEGTDYGKIPGAGDKPALLQPGAQKLCELYGLSFTFVNETSTEDWDKPFFFYRRRCVLTRRSDGAFVCDGIGTSNSKEKKNWNSNPFPNVNTMEKIACKRALVMAVLGATRTSGMFTQDIEDNPEAFQRPGPRKTKPQPSADVALEQQLRASLPADPVAVDWCRSLVESMETEDESRKARNAIMDNLPPSPERSELGKLWTDKVKAIKSRTAVEQ